MCWFDDHIDEAIHLRCLGDEMAGLLLSGPTSRKVIERLTDGPVEDLSLIGCGTFDIGFLHCRAGPGRSVS